MSKREQEKKAREIYLTNLFFQRNGLGCDCILDGGEPPDVIVARDGSVIGIEITQLLPANTQLKQYDSAQEKIIKQAESFYLKMDAPPVRAGISFSGKSIIGYRDEKLGYALAELVANHIPCYGESIELLTKDDGIKLPDEIESIRISRLDYLQEPEWHKLGGSWFSKTSSETIRKSVESKNKKAQIYRDKFSEIWLVLFYETSAPPFLEFSEALTPKDTRSLFNRTFVLEDPSGRAWEVDQDFRNATLLDADLQTFSA